jgi:hypothetical protein
MGCHPKRGFKINSDDDFMRILRLQDIDGCDKFDSFVVSPSRPVY